MPEDEERDNDYEDEDCEDEEQDDDLLRKFTGWSLR